jgi:hypothetical protein
MSAPDQRAWRKSSYSGGGGGNCVEVAHTASDVAVRDSKHVGPMISVSPGAWRTFLGGTLAAPRPATPAR